MVSVVCCAIGFDEIGMGIQGMWAGSQSRAEIGGDQCDSPYRCPRDLGEVTLSADQRPTEDHFLMTRRYLENKMQVVLGGRAAERIVFGDVSTGAADDLQKATAIARGIVMRHGMHARMGNAVYEEERQFFLDQTGPRSLDRSLSEETAREIDCAPRAISSAVCSSAQ